MSNSPEKFVVQLTGQPDSGKTEVANHLHVMHGFEVVRPSDFIRRYARQHGVVLGERKDFAQVHKEMLRELGRRSLSRMLLATPSERVCVDGMRVPGHAENIRSAAPGILLGLDCRLEDRFERSKSRQSPLDKPNIEEFLADEQAEYRSLDPYEISTLTVMEMADYRLRTDKSLQQVCADVDEIVVPLLNTRA